MRVQGLGDVHEGQAALVQHSGLIDLLVGEGLITDYDIRPVDEGMNLALADAVLEAQYVGG